MNIIEKTTNRGFKLVEFNDGYDNKCVLQKSSLVAHEAIWLGVTDVKPKILVSKTIEGGAGWVPHKIPDDVLINSRMHLTVDQVKDLIPILQNFVETGEVQLNEQKL